MKKVFCNRHPPPFLVQLNASFVEGAFSTPKYEEMCFWKLTN
jgi:hypothetical protein